MTNEDNGVIVEGCNSVVELGRCGVFIVPSVFWWISEHWEIGQHPLVGFVHQVFPHLCYCHRIFFQGVRKVKVDQLLLGEKGILLGPSSSTKENVSLDVGPPFKDN